MLSGSFTGSRISLGDKNVIVLQSYSNWNSPGCPSSKKNDDLESSKGKLQTIEGVKLSVFPNPFQQTTTLTFSIGYETEAILEIYNITGVKVATLFNGDVSAGMQNRAEFDGRELSDGMYIYRLTTDYESIMDKLTLVK